MRVLLIHQAYCGPDDPGGTRHYELGVRLAAAGHAFTVVTSAYNYLTGKRKNPPSASSGIAVHQAATLRGWHRSYCRRVLVFLSFAFTSALTALRRKTPDLVLATSPPIFQAISSWAVATVWRRPFVLEIRDLWPEFAIELGILRNPILISLARSIERFLYRHAQHIVVNSPAYVDYLLQKGVQAEKISVIPNGVDVSCFSADDRGAGFRREYQLEDKSVVMYAGALGLANDVDCLLRAAAHLRDDRQIIFMIVGDGKELPRLRRKALSEHLDHVTFVPAQPKQRMPEILAAADICVATLKHIPMFRMTYPNKVFDYMAAGRPTLLAIDGVIREVIENSRGGSCVQPGDDRALANAILKLRDTPELRNQMGKNARAYVSANFNRETQAGQFAALLERVCME